MCWDQELAKIKVAIKRELRKRLSSDHPDWIIREVEVDKPSRTARVVIEMDLERLDIEL